MADDKATRISPETDIARNTGEGAESGTDEENMKCGYGKCTPDCLQPCAKPGILLTTLCLLVLVEGKKSGYWRYVLVVM